MLLWQQEPLICPCPEPAVSIPQPPILFLDTAIIIIIIIIIITITTAIYPVQLLLNLCILLQQIQLTIVTRTFYNSE